MLAQVNLDSRNHLLVLYRVKMGVVAIAAATVAARAANQFLNLDDFLQR